MSDKRPAEISEACGCRESVHQAEDTASAKALGWECIWNACVWLQQREG